MIVIIIVDVSSSAVMAVLQAMMDIPATRANLAAMLLNGLFPYCSTAGDLPDVVKYDFHSNALCSYKETHNSAETNNT